MESFLKKKWLYAAISPVVIIIVTAVFIAWDGLSDQIMKSDVAVVLGYAVKNDHQPSPRLQSRLDKAVTLFRKGLFKQVIVSGGRGKHGYDEARDMKRYLASKGIPAGRIYEDPAGSNTYLTARNASRFMKKGGMKSAIVITQYFHISRSKLALRRFGVKPVYSAHADFFSPADMYSLLREVAAYYAYVFRFYDK